MAENPINTAAYGAAHYSTAYLNVPPNMHRLRNALGLMVGAYLGRKLMDILAGETINGKKIDKDDLPLPLRPLHGVLAYDHHSDNPHDRWMKVFDMSVPAILAGVGAGLGSASFFTGKDAKGDPLFLTRMGKDASLTAEKFTVADAERRALAIQGKSSGLWSSLSAVFGSASGFGLFPSFLNYSSTLGTTFTIRAERAMVGPFKWIGRAFNSHSPYPFRPTRLVGNMIEYAAGNPSANPKQLEAYANGILKTWFKKVKPEQIEEFVGLIKSERNKFIGAGMKPELAEEKIQESLKKMFSDTGLEKILIKLKLDPREAAIGDMGFVSTTLHMLGDSLGMGTSKKMEAARKLLQEGLEKRHPQLDLKFGPFTPKPPAYADDTLKKLATAGFIGTGVGMIGMIAASKDTTVEDLKTAGNKADDNNITAASAATNGHNVHSKKERGFVDGKLLDTAEGITGMFNASIGSHRVHCALGLVVGSLLGDKVMDALTGVAFNGKKIPKEQVWKPLQKFYKALAFNPHSDLPHDKWMQVLRWGVPGVIGTLAVVQGSKMFFEKRHEKLKHANTLDDVEDKATMAQSQPWSYTSAVSGLFGYPSGLPMLPFLNYSTNLGTRFSMGSGRKVALPIMGKIWSNNSTLFPFGPSGMIELMIKESINNKAYDPELLETYAIGVLKPWFENVTPKQVEDFVMEIHKVRDQYFKDGGVPEEMKAQLEKELRAHLKGAGLEETLEHIGLDPTKAIIANNGLSGAIANALGAGKTIDKIKADYTKSYRERLEKRRTQPGTEPTLIN